MIDRSTVELGTVSVGDPHKSYGTQLRTGYAKLICQAIGLVDRDFCVFEDHDALIFELFAYDEIKTEVGHWISHA